MNLPLFIARRTANSSTSTQSTMVRIATAAVAVSVAVMVVTIAVVIGFKKQIRATISDMSADIVVTDLASLYGAEVRPVTVDNSLGEIFDSTEGIEHIDGYAMRGCIARSKSGTAGIVLKGSPSFDDSNTIAKSIIEGTLPRTEEQRYKELLLPDKVATTLGVACGERIELLLFANGQTPEREIFKICGIYQAVGDLPISMALSDIRNVQKINGWPSDTFSGFEIRLREGYNAEVVSDQLNDALFEYYVGDANLSSLSTNEIYANIFAWLETHDINATVIVVIMFIVALFNMITALLILLFERTRMVGILKSLGMNNREVRKIFLYQSARIVGRGLLIGNAVAIALILIQKYTGVIKLDAAAYFVAEIPVNIGVVEILTINIIFAAAILALLFATTAIVTKIKPSEAVKYE